MKRIAFFLMMIIICMTSVFSPVFADPPADADGGTVIDAAGATQEIIYGDDKYVVEDSEKAGGMSLKLPDALNKENYGGQKGFWEKILGEYRELITIISSIATLTFVLIFIISFVKLGNTAGNPQGHTAAMTGIIISGIATAGCGGVALITGVFYNLFL